MKLHPDVAETDDLFFAAYVVYHGHDPLKCRTTGKQTVWTFLVKECDFSIMKDELADSETPILFKAFVGAMKTVFHIQKLARESSGEYVSGRWREVIRRANEAHSVR